MRDWPRYGRVDELPEECAELRANYYALVAFCDSLLGGLLDYFDARDLATQEIYQYTMPQHIRQPLSTDELRLAEFAPTLPFTKGMPVLQIPVLQTSPMHNDYGPGALLERETRLYDLEADPGQLHPLQSQDEEARVAALMWSLMRSADAPVEAYIRLNFVAE